MEIGKGYQTRVSAGLGLASETIETLYYVATDGTIFKSADIRYPWNKSNTAFAGEWWRDAAVITRLPEHAEFIGNYARPAIPVGLATRAKFQR